MRSIRAESFGISQRRGQAPYDWLCRKLGRLPRVGPRLERLSASAVQLALTSEAPQSRQRELDLQTALSR